MKNDINSRWPEKVEIIRRCAVTILWATVIIVVLFAANKVLFSNTVNDPSSQSLPKKELSIESAVSYQKINKEILEALAKARSAAMERADAELNGWIKDRMDLVDPCFLDWYFSYWTQQYMELSGIYHSTLHFLFSSHPDSKQKTLQTIQKEFEKRVMQPETSAMEMEVITKNAMVEYASRLRSELDIIARNYDVHDQEWNRFVRDISKITSDMDLESTVPLKFKVATGLAGNIVLAGPYRKMVESIGKRIGSRITSKYAAGPMAKLFGRTVLKVTAGLFGPVVITSVWLWDYYDHARSEAAYRPVLKRSIEEYLALVKEKLLNDSDNGILAIIRAVEEQVMAARYVD